MCELFKVKSLPIKNDKKKKLYTIGTVHTFANQ